MIDQGKRHHDHLLTRFGFAGMRLSWLGVALGFLTPCLAPSIAQAQGAFAGTWTIDRYVESPWIVMEDDGVNPVPTSDLKLYLNKSVLVGPSAISGTSPLSCAHPHYHVRSADKPETIFHNKLALGDMNPVSEARKLGITTHSILTLVTGCADLEFHMVKPDTIMFGLPDRVFFLSRVKGQ